MGEPFSIITGGVGFAIPVARFVSQLSGVKDETQIVVQQAKTVAGDIKDAENLYLKTRPRLSDEQQFRVTEVIKECKGALGELTSLVEPARRNVAQFGTVNVVRRFDWVFRKGSAAGSYQHRLDVCQRSLQGQILMLRMIPLSMHVEDPPQYAEIWVEPPLQQDGSPVGNNGQEQEEDFSDEEKPTESISEESKAEPIPSLHPERLRYESLQRYSANRAKPGMSIHPERLRYEEMQRRHREHSG